MKITSNKAELSAITYSKVVKPLPDSDLCHKPIIYKPPKPSRRKTNNFVAGVKLRRDSGGGVPNGRRSRPETPLLRWKCNEDVNDNASTTSSEEKKKKSLVEKCGRNVKTVVSVRMLGAALWRMQLPEVPNDTSDQKLGFQAGHVEVPFHGHHRSSKVHDFLFNDSVQCPRSVSGPTNGLLHKLEPSFQIPNSAMEGATKWDPVGWKTAEDIKKICGHREVFDRQGNSASTISDLEAELEQARARVQQLETERRSSKKKVEQFLQKLNEEKTAWRSREHEKIRAIIDDMKADMSRERKYRQRMELVNSKLVNELANAKLSAKRYLQDYERERKGRELIEQVCDELAKEIGEDKAEVEVLKREYLKLRDEVDDERRMLQMAEVWREERVQMKLVDAKVTLEEKYSQMNRIIADLEYFLSSRGMNPDVEELKRAEQLQQAAASLNICDIGEFTYEPPNPDDIFSVFEDVSFVEPNVREIEPCTAYSPASHASKIRTVSPDGGVYDKDNFHKHSHDYVNQSDDFEEEGSDWETVSHVEEQDSSYSPEASVSSVNKNCRYSNVSRGGVDWEGIIGDGTQVTEISEVCCGPARQLKASSKSTVWKSRPSNGDSYKLISVEGINGRLSNGRPSNGATLSPDHCSSKGGFSPSDLTGQWSSPDSSNSHMTRGMKGCIEWPRNSHKSSLKSKLLEARIESQKVQLRHVLKQKI